MVAWMTEFRRRRRFAAVAPPPVRETPPPPRGRAMTGPYALLYEYLEHRHADTVVLTFGEIEDLLGFNLPDAARLREWWTDVDPSIHSDAWMLAHRTAVPNLLARTVVFDRAA